MGNLHHAPSLGITHRPSLGDLNRLSSGMDSFANMRLDGAGGQGAGQGEKGDAVPVAFDEGVLRGLCEMDVSWADSTGYIVSTEIQGALPLLVDRIKQSIASCKVSQHSYQESATGIVSVVAAADGPASCSLLSVTSGNRREMR